MSFRPPDYDLSGDAVHGREDHAPIPRSPDRTEAKLQVVIYYGGLDATGFDIGLKKFGKTWVMIEAEMAWIS